MINFSPPATNRLNSQRYFSSLQSTHITITKGVAWCWKSKTHYCNCRPIGLRTRKLSVSIWNVIERESRSTEEAEKLCCWLAHSFVLIRDVLNSRMMEWWGGGKTRRFRKNEKERGLGWKYERKRELERKRERGGMKEI